MSGADDLIRMLKLEPLPREGGFFREIYRSHTLIPGTNPPRALATSILYLLTPATFSALHMLPSDETWHFYLGDPVEMLLLRQDGTSEIFTLGHDIENGQKVQLTVPTGVWQGSRLVDYGSFALMGTTMSPGFDFFDYIPADRELLIEKYPAREKLIITLTGKVDSGRI